MRAHRRLVVSVLVPALFALAACEPGGGDTTGNGGTTGVAGSGTGAAGAAGTTGASTGNAGTMGAAGTGAAGAAGTTGASTGNAGMTGAAGTGTAGAGAAAGTTGAAGTGTAGAGAAGRGGAGGGGTAGTGTTGVAGATGAGGSAVGAYNPNFKEFVGDGCTVGTPANVNTSFLPDLFANYDGTRMSKKSDWACRRAEIKKAVETYIHGPKPGRPTTVTGSVTSTMIRVHVEHAGKTIDFMASVSLPSGTTGPVPAVIGLGATSLDTFIRGEGIATINYSHSMLAAEGTRNGLFTNVYGTATGASAQVAWAWGVSRIIDVLVDEKAAGRNNVIDPTGIGVTGCSRNGKGAFTIGAFDERIALGIPMESGTGGVSALRVVNSAPRGPNGNPAQSISSAWTEAQGWFGTVFGNFRNNVNVMPADMHSLVAMYAPRGFLVLDNSRIGELCSTCQHAASAAGQKVYEALGAGKNIEYHGGNTSDPHQHCSFYTSQQEPLRRALHAHLKRSAPADGRVAPAAVATADVAMWIPWTAPTLAD
jgi:hypothetical protein